MSEPLLKGKYALDRPIGRGGMAEVFLGRTVGASGFSVPVAIKRILRESSDNEKFRAMFCEEALLTSRLHHRNVVAVIDFDRDHEGRLFLVMPFVDGTDLLRLMRTGGLPLELVLFIAYEILRGLAHAHELPRPNDKVRGIIHRDISPTNILISWNGEVQITDFGIATARESTAADATKTLKGKPSYMSPEQIRGRTLTGRSDLFAVGVVLWEMLCRKTLFRRDSTVATMHAVLTDQVPSPRVRRPEVPADVERVVMCLLEKKADRRYPNAAAAAVAIGECSAFPKNGTELLAALLAARSPLLAPPVSDDGTSESSAPTLASSESSTLVLPAGQADASAEGSMDVPDTAALATPPSAVPAIERAVPDVAAVAPLAASAPPIAERAVNPYEVAARAIAAKDVARSHRLWRYALAFVATLVVAGVVAAIMFVGMSRHPVATRSEPTSPVPALSTPASKEPARSAEPGASATPVPRGTNSALTTVEAPPSDLPPSVKASSHREASKPAAVSREEVAAPTERRPTTPNHGKKHMKPLAPAQPAAPQDRIYVFDTETKPDNGGR